MNYEFERHIDEARKRRDIRAINAWTALRGVFDSLAQANVINELPKLEIISTDAPLSETTQSTEKAKYDLVTINGAQLRFLRRSANFTQSELAKRIGINQGRISHLERGKITTIPSSVAIQLAELYQTELATFILGPEEVKKG